MYKFLNENHNSVVNYHSTWEYNHKIMLFDYFMDKKQP